MGMLRIPRMMLRIPRIIWRPVPIPAVDGGEGLNLSRKSEPKMGILMDQRRFLSQLWSCQVELSELEERKLRGKPSSEEETILYFNLPNKSEYVYNICQTVKNLHIVI